MARPEMSCGALNAQANNAHIYVSARSSSRHIPPASALTFSTINLRVPRVTFPPLPSQSRDLSLVINARRGSDTACFPFARYLKKPIARLNTRALRPSSYEKFIPSGTPEKTSSPLTRCYISESLALLKCVAAVATQLSRFQKHCASRESGSIVAASSSQTLPVGAAVPDPRVAASQSGRGGSRGRRAGALQSGRGRGRASASQPSSKAPRAPLSTFPFVNAMLGDQGALEQGAQRSRDVAAGAVIEISDDDEVV
ncbi:hypothetical protein F4823DRAFT_559467 [Ustulina deusta]|nr:hypothetical protein F4823DRAFT_559467 [Ustulina deusta]